MSEGRKESTWWVIWGIKYICLNCLTGSRVVDLRVLLKEMDTRLGSGLGAVGLIGLDGIWLLIKIGSGFWTWTCGIKDVMFKGPNV